MLNNDIDKIKSIILSIYPGSTAYLFGSRSDGTNSPESDYDIMVEVPGNPDIRTKISLSTQITKTLADRGITADVIVESAEDIRIKRNLTGSIVKNAMKRAIRL